MTDTTREPGLSLVTTPTSSLRRCSACSSTRVTAIAMTLTDGSTVDFVSCHACEHKVWRQGSEELALSRVLDKVRKQR